MKYKSMHTKNLKFFVNNEFKTIGEMTDEDVDQLMIKVEGDVMSSKHWSPYEIFIVYVAIVFGYILKYNNQKQIDLIQKRLVDRSRESIRSKLARLERRKK